MKTSNYQRTSNSLDVARSYFCVPLWPGRWGRVVARARGGSRLEPRPASESGEARDAGGDAVPAKTVRDAHRHQASIENMYYLAIVLFDIDYSRMTRTVIRRAERWFMITLIIFIIWWSRFWDWWFDTDPQCHQVDARAHHILWSNLHNTDFIMQV